MYIHCSLFSHIQNLVQRLHMLKNLAYSESWYIRSLPLLHPGTCPELCHIYENLRIFRTLIYLKPDTYLEPSQRYKMGFFAKIVKNYNYFYKALQLRSLTGFWISLSKYSLTCAMYCMIHIQNPVYYCTLRHIQAFSHPVHTYSTILWHIWTPA